MIYFARQIKPTRGVYRYGLFVLPNRVRWSDDIYALIDKDLGSFGTRSDFKAALDDALHDTRFTVTAYNSISELRHGVLELLV